MGWVNSEYTNPSSQTEQNTQQESSPTHEFMVRPRLRSMDTNTTQTHQHGIKIYKN